MEIARIIGACDQAQSTAEFTTAAANEVVLAAASLEEMPETVESDHLRVRAIRALEGLAETVIAEAEEMVQSYTELIEMIRRDFPGRGE